MASTDDNLFNSLDPLGPEYGRINPPIIDSKGLSAFEGDKINIPKVDLSFNEKFYPIAPGIESLNNPSTSIQKNIVGIPPNKPGINKGQRYDDLVKNLRDYASNSLKSLQDPNNFSKIYSYNAGPDSNAFYKRYQAYGQEKFDEIGFSPLRDNEALFNSRTTKWDDFSRMMTNSFIPLFSKGFVSGPKDLAKMLTGDFTGTDLEDAAEYEKLAAIGQSTKGGVGGFLNNAAMNFAYSAGIITEAVVEEVALAAMSVGTSGGTLPLLFARTAENIGRIGKGLNVFKYAKDGLKAVNKALDAVNSVEGARQFWNAAKGFGKAINPLSNTFDAARLAYKADNLTNLARASKTAGGFYRDVRNINMALSEARLEAGMEENHIYDNLYNEYYANTGKAPTDQEQYEMLQTAKKGSLNTLYWNTGIIYGSNLIVFPNIVGPKGGLKNFVKSTLKELSEVSGGKFGNLGKIVYDQSKKSFAFQKNNFENWAKGWMRNPIHKSVGNTIGYFKANFTEGIQENLQEVIGGANERYYTDTFNSKVIQSHNYNKSLSQYDYFKEELGKQFSGQGFETFASGFVMGTFAAPLNKSIEYLGIGYNKIFDKQAYQDLKNKKLEITKSLINNLNTIDIKDFLDSKIFNYGRQDVISNIKESGNKKEALDAVYEAMLEQMDMLVRNGSFENFKEKLKDLQQLTPEEFEDNIKTVPKGEGAKYQAKISSTIDKMDRINSRYNTYKEKYQNPVDLENLPPKGTQEYINAIALYNAWEESIKNAVFFNETFEDTMLRKKEILQRFVSQKPLETLSQRDSELIFDHDVLRNEVGLLKNEIEALKDLSDPASKEELKKKQKKLKAMEKLGEKTVNFTNFFNRYERVDEIKKLLQKEKGDEPVTDEDIENVLNEYFGEFTEDNKIKNVSDYETAFKDYLKTVADVNNDYIFDEKLDEAFMLLADHHKLNSESRALIKGVNLLHDPGSFLDLVERNQKWMKDLYERRGEYYQKMITEQFDVVIDNALLNALANKSIYISLEDFAEWRNNGIPPSEFYDHSRKLVIPEGTPEYEEYYMLFQQASELKAEQTGTVPTSIDQQLNDSLDRLEQKKQQEINNLPKVETKVSLNKLAPNANGVITIKMIQDQLEPGTYAEQELNGELFILFKDVDNILKENDAEGDPVDITNTQITFTDLNVYKIEEKPDPNYLNEIENRYEELRTEIIDDYTNKINDLEKQEAEKTTVEAEPITSDTALEEIAKRSAILYNSLRNEFETNVLKKLGDEEFTNMTPEQERNLFENFIKGNLKAKELIDNFNKEQKTKKPSEEKEEFEFMYQGKKMKTEDLKTVAELEKMKRRFDKMIKDISEMENPTTSDMTNKSKYSIVSRDLEKLIDTRNKKEEALDLPEGFRYVEEGEVLPAGNYTTKLSISGKKTITNAPKRKVEQTTTTTTADAKAEIERRRQEDLNRIFKKFPALANIFNNNLTKLDKYLKSIFPNASSDFKGELFFHGTKAPLTGGKFKISEKSLGKGLWFTKQLGYAKIQEDTDTGLTYGVILGIENPKNFYDATGAILVQTPREFEKQFDKGVNDAAVFHHPQNEQFSNDGGYNQVVVFDESKVHILGDENDLQLAKEFNAKYDAELAALEETQKSIPEDPQSSDDIDSPTQDPASRKVEVIDDSKRYTVNDFKADLGQVKTIDDLKLVLSNLKIKVSEELVAFEDLTVMSQLANEKSQEINSGILKIEPSSLEKGQELIVKNIIFDNNIPFALDNDTVIIESVDKTNKNITINAVGNSNKMTISFDKLNEMFKLKDVVMDTTEQVATPVTKEEQEMITQSSDLADNFLNNSSKLDEIEKNVSKKSIENLDSELLNDLNC